MMTILRWAGDWWLEPGGLVVKKGFPYKNQGVKHESSGVPLASLLKQTKKLYQLLV